MAFLTLLMAAVYVGFAHWAVHGGHLFGWEWDGVQRINSTRILLQAMMPGDTGAVERSPGPFFLPGARPRMMSPAERAAQLRLQHEIAAVEVVVYVWQRMIWGLAGILAVVALLSWVTRWGRFWHVIGALATILATVLTLGAVRYLDIPDGSGLTLWPLSVQQYGALLAWFGQHAARQEEAVLVPSGGGLGGALLAAKTYWIIAAGFSAYAWIVLVVCLTPRRSVSPPATSQPPPPPSA